MGKRGRVEGLAIAGSKEWGGEGEMGRVRLEEAMGRGRWRGGQWEGGDGEGVLGRRRCGRGLRGGGGVMVGGEEGARGWGISQMDMMKCPGGHMECFGGMRLQGFLTLFTHATPGSPASLYHRHRNIFIGSYY